MPRKKKLLVIEAHPDDAEFHAGGLMTRWREAGHELMIVCLTDGSAGHQSMDRPALAKRRALEAEAAAALLGAELRVWKEADGTLQPSVTLRERLIAQIRGYGPDLIVSHRPADYHPDHRATATLVQDASFLLQVPNVRPDVAPLEQVPPILLTYDRFTYPRPFRADWVIDTEAYLERVTALLSCHESQVFEWLPHVAGLAAPQHNRTEWLQTWYSKRPRQVAKSCGTGAMKFAEAFEISEYGGRFAPSDYLDV